MLSLGAQMLGATVLHAQLTLLATDKGGRWGSIKPGYRPTLSFGETDSAGRQKLHSCVVYFDEWLPSGPGSTLQVRLVPVDLSRWPAIKAETNFQVMEGTRCVGKGKFALRRYPSI